MTIYDHKTSANQKAFNSVLDAIELQILKQQKMIAQTTLSTLFREEFSHSGYPSEDYRSCKLKDRIIRNEINNRIGFVNADQQLKDALFSSWFIAKLCLWVKLLTSHINKGLIKTIYTVLPIYADLYKTRLKAQMNYHGHQWHKI